MKKSVLFIVLFLSVHCIWAQRIDVLHYDINLNITNLSQKKIKGYTDVKLVAKQAISTIQLDLLRLNVDSVKLGSSKLTFTYNDTIINITTPLLALNDTTELRVYYQGSPFTDPSSFGGGFYFSSDGAYAYNVGVGFSANPHNLGRTWIPSADDFTDRAAYDYHIRVSKPKKAICNGLLKSITDEGDGTATYHWKMEEHIPAYLSSVAIAEYATIRDSLQGMDRKILYEINVAKTDSIAAVNSFKNLDKILSAFEKRFGPYRWPRIGYNAVPQIGGAMEHASNIAFLKGFANGSLTYEYLFAHELAHHWFGDLVTCSTAEDMWLNEGWAVFCEYIYKEALYGEKAMSDYIRTKHKAVLSGAHVDDKGYYAVSGVPHAITYGTTVYEKGGLVAHTLRGYLGDSLFFSAMKSYLTDKAFSDMSSVGFRDYLQTKTGVNLQEFFAGWVFSPGFPQFSVDSFGTTSDMNDHYVKVKLRQKQYGSSHIWKDNRVELLFMNAAGEKKLKVMTQSGESSTQIFKLPFIPSVILVDPKGKIADATTEYFQTIKTTGIKSMPDAYCTIDVKKVSDSAQLMVYHHWVGPDTIPRLDHLTQKISTGHYWKIDGIIPESFKAKATFTYIPDFDKDLAANEDSLELFYRPTEGIFDYWRKIDAVKNTGSSITDMRGTFAVDELQKGEYAIGFVGLGFFGIENINDKISQVLVYPNPADNSFMIRLSKPVKGKLILVNSNGQKVLEKMIGKSVSEINVMRNNLAAGLYQISISDGSTIVAAGKVIFK